MGDVVGIGMSGGFNIPEIATMVMSLSLRSINCVSEIM